MAKLPKFKIKWQTIDGEEKESICDLGQAKAMIFGSWSWGLIVAEGELVRSYEELSELANRTEHRNKKALNVLLLDPAVGGG